MIGLAMIFASTGAATFVDGDALYRSCQANPQAYCQGYVTGVIDAASEVMDQLDQKPVFCPGEEITVAQARDAVIAFLKDHPGARDQGASGLVIAAMAKAFPCKN